LIIGKVFRWGQIRPQDALSVPQSSFNQAIVLHGGKHITDSHASGKADGLHVCTVDRQIALPLRITAIGGGETLSNIIERFDELTKLLFLKISLHGMTPTGGSHGGAAGKSRRVVTGGASGAIDHAWQTFRDRATVHRWRQQSHCADWLDW
jgi:hypothetical protein